MYGNPSLSLFLSLSPSLFLSLSLFLALFPSLSLPPSLSLSLSSHQFVEILVMGVPLFLDDISGSCLTGGSIDILEERLQSMGVGEICSPHTAKARDHLLQ